MGNYSKLPRVLIVGTLPYDPNESSRALDTYFHDFPDDNIAMIFSNVNIPVRWKYNSLYQITDKDVLNHCFKRKKPCGRIIDNSMLSDSKGSNYNVNLYNRLKKKNTLRFYLRYWLWKRNQWKSSELYEWIRKFNPEAIYICFSDDYFILDIGYSISKEFNLPIIAQIGDDYYFQNYANIAFRPYFNKYKILFENIMNTDGFGVYISEKLSDFYNKNFKKQGVPVYLSSEVPCKRNDFLREFNYFGKTNLGRDKSLMTLGDALNKIDGNFYIDIYTNDANNFKAIEKYKKHHCYIHPSIPYSKVKDKMCSGSFNIIASGMKEKDIDKARFSLSTKVADSIACGAPLIAVGPIGDGAIDYLKSNDCAFVFDGFNFNDLKNFVLNDSLINKKIENALKTYQNNHSVVNNRLLFEKECSKLIASK